MQAATTKATIREVFTIAARHPYIAGEIMAAFKANDHGAADKYINRLIVAETFEDVMRTRGA